MVYCERCDKLGFEKCHCERYKMAQVFSDRIISSGICAEPLNDHQQKALEEFSKLAPEAMIFQIQFWYEDRMRDNERLFERMADNG